MLFTIIFCLSTQEARPPVGFLIYSHPMGTLKLYSRSQPEHKEVLVLNEGYWTVTTYKRDENRTRKGLEGYSYWFILRPHCSPLRVHAK